MKKFVAFLVAVTVMVTGIMTAFANVNISINGSVVEVPEGMGEARIESDRTFVPVRFILENFGYHVEYMPEDRQIMGTDGKGSLFMMQIGSPYLFYKSPDSSETAKIVMDVEPFINPDEGRTYVPARFLAEAFGYNVDFDVETTTVLISEK